MIWNITLLEVDKRRFPIKFMIEADSEYDAVIEGRHLINDIQGIYSGDIDEVIAEPYKKNKKSSGKTLMEVFSHESKL